MVGCYIVFKLTTKPMLTFWVGKAEMLELGHIKCDKACDTDSQLQQADEGKYQFLKPKATSFCTTEFTYINFYP